MLLINNLVNNSNKDGSQIEIVLFSLSNLKEENKNMKKTCKKHGELSIDQIRSYTRNRRGREELTFSCKLCHRETASQARNIDRTKANEWARIDRKNHPEKYRAQRKRRRLMHGSKIVENEILRRFKLSKEEYDEMVKEHNNLCAICFKEETRRSRTEGEICRLAIDHCHRTNKVRGLLCHACNIMIGKAGDSIEILESAITYLRKFNS